MLDALPNDTQGPTAPEPEARSSASQPVQGKAPAWEDPAEHPAANDPPDPPALPAPPHSEGTHGLMLERGGRNGMTGTAERIGSVVGTAQRRVRRGLELVRRPTGGPIVFPSSGGATATAAEGKAERVLRRTQVVEEEEKVSELRRQSAQRMDEWSELAGERFQQLRRELSGALSHYRERAQQFGQMYPLQTIAAIAGVCFGLGVALRIRRSHRG